MMPDGGQLEEISFDLYERYALLEQIANRFRPPDGAFEVLDVGGHTDAFWPGFPSLAGVLIPGAQVTVADIQPTANLRNYVQADGIHLPFRDGAFDLCCSLDTLEHVPADCRPAFLSELLRVTRDGLYLAFPFDSDANRWAESLVLEHVNVVLKNSLPALQEHRRFGLPDRKSVTEFVSRTAYPSISFTQANTDIWLLMMLTYHTLRMSGTDFVQELNRRFNRVYATQDWNEPHYRAGILLSKRRNLADLQTLRNALVSSGERADLEGVLAFCQLFLNIAQHGRVTVDKDRHIRNIEQELANVRTSKDSIIRALEQELANSRRQQENWNQLSAVLQHLESGIIEAPTLPGAAESPPDWTPERLSRLLERLHERRVREVDSRLSQMAEQLAQTSTQLNEMAEQAARAAQLERISAEAEQNAVRTAAQLDKIEARLAMSAQRDELATQGAQLAAHLESIRQRLDGLQGRMDFQARVDSRLRDLEIGLVTNKRAVQAIYDSRIWRSLSAAGQLLLRASGRRTKEAVGHWTPSEPAMPLPSPSETAIADEFLGLICDYPCDGDVLPVRDMIEIRGWTLAPSGIDRVLIQVNGDSPVSAVYGVLRPDVARAYPAVGGAGQAGFRYFWDLTGLPEGPCTIRVTAISGNGQSREIVRSVLIDWQTPAGYGVWIARNEPRPEDLNRMRREAVTFAVCPTISIVVPVYQSPLPLLTRAIESVLAQTYPNWELCLADDGSNDAALTTLLNQYAARESRIRLTGLPQNRGISAATNAALKLASGDYIGFLDHDDELAAFALSEVVRAINENPETELWYSDEDKLDEFGRRYDAFFKPDWSPDLFRACNYLCHFAVVKRSLAEKLGGLDETYNGAQDYEYLLRATEHARMVRRIPKILYHWRAVAGSTAKSADAKPEASADGKRALLGYLARNVPGARVEETGMGRYRVRYPIAADARVTILTPTAGHKNVFRAVEDVIEKTAYKNYDILLVDNSRADRVKDYACRLAARRAPVRYFDWRGKPFNFAQMNNAAARACDAPYILFLNDDTTVITSEWLTAMLEHAQRPEVGAVGAQLWYPNNVIQHAGVVMGIYGNCSHAFKGVPGELPHYYFDFPNLIRNCSAVTGACMLVAREKFFEAGAFDEVNLAVAFQDVDLCLKLLELGYRNIYTPYAKLYHYESATKTEKDKIPDPLEDAFMKHKWARYIANDPYYNPNLARRKEDFSLAID